MDRRRALRFQRIANFRDLGGYPATGGRVTQWGLLYRSGHLGNATTRDLDHLASLGIHTVVDFRTDRERADRPCRLPDAISEVLELPVLDSGKTSLVEEMRTRVANNDFEEFDPFARMTLTYQRFATEYADAYAEFIHAVLTAAGRPVLWLCTAGKDRTGFAAAVLLRLLGVDEETAIGDYLLSARYIDHRRGLIMLLRLAKGGRIAAGVKGLMGVHREWITAALRAIDSTWGGFEAYAHDGLRLSREDTDRLRENLTQG